MHRLPLQQLPLTVKKMKKTQSIAICGLLTAFAVVVMMISNLMPSGMYTFPAVSGVIVYTAAITSGRSYSWLAYIAVSILSLFLCADKQAPLCFILFFGYYPLLKELIERIRLKAAAFLIKLLVFNAAGSVIWLLLTFVFSVPAEEFSVFGVDLPAVIIVILNIAFLLYDLALGMFFVRYKEKIYKLVTKLNKKY